LIKEMVKDHKEDLSEFHVEVSNGRDIGVKNAALQASKTLSEHLQMAQQPLSHKLHLSHKLVT
jgi:putative membrane protein